MRKLKIGITGTGQFAKCFIPLFQQHPHVSEIILSDLEDARLQTVAQEFGVSHTVCSHADLCKTDVDAIAIFTQHQLHAPQALEALQHGKHVYCAVPAAHPLLI